MTEDNGECLKIFKKVWKDSEIGIYFPKKQEKQISVFNKNKKIEKANLPEETDYFIFTRSGKPAYGLWADDKTRKPTKHASCLIK